MIINYLSSWPNLRSEFLRRILVCVFSSILMVACSSPKVSAPIKDKSTNSSKSNSHREAKAEKKPQAAKEEKTVAKVDGKQDTKSEAKPEPIKSDKPSENKVDSTVDPELKLLKPASGEVLGGYNGSTNKGVDIAGKLGDSVVSAADGKVIFSDTFKGYGNTLIIKHNSNYVTVYAHNKSLLVKEGQSVKRGQKIAEMGNTESDRVKLHFEVRRDGKPVDPSRYLQ